MPCRGSSCTFLVHKTSPGKSTLSTQLDKFSLQHFVATCILCLQLLVNIVSKNSSTDCRDFVDAMDATTTPRPLRIIKQANNPPVILHVPKQRRTRAGSVPAAPVPFANDTRSRAVTVGSMQSGIPNSTFQHLGTLKPSRTQPSLRQRLLSRVMSGVSSKSQVGHAAMGREVLVQQLHGNDTGDIEDFGGPRPSTASSIGTVSTLGCNLELALAAFPTPPTSTVTSPTTLSSFDTSRTTSTPARRLVHPSNNAIPGARLSLLPEIDQLSLDTGESVFVAVEIAGIVGPMDESYDISARPKGLDVAVVVDST